MDRLIIQDKFNIIGNYTSNFTKENLSPWIKELFQNKQSAYSEFKDTDMLQCLK